MVGRDSTESSASAAAAAAGAAAVAAAATTEAALPGSEGLEPPGGLGADGEAAKVLLYYRWEGGGSVLYGGLSC